MNRTFALTLALAAAALARPAAADLVISSSDPSENNSVTTAASISLTYANNTHGVAFTVNQVLTLNSVVVNIAFESNLDAPESVTAQLLKVGAPELGQSGPTEYSYTVLGTSSSVGVNGYGTYSFSDQTLSFHGEELDPGSTYLIVLDGTLPHPGSNIAWNYTIASSSAFSTSFGSIDSGTWQYYTLSDQTSVVYNNVPNQTPELTINADVVTPEPSTLALATTGLAVAGLTGRFRTRRRAVRAAGVSRARA